MVATQYGSSTVGSWEAVVRSFVVIACILGLAVVVITTINFFPRQSGYIERTPIIPGDHAQVEWIGAGDGLTESEFLHQADGLQTFMTVDEKGVSYLALGDDGSSYLHRQSIGYGDQGFRYESAGIEVQDGQFIRTLDRDIYIAVASFGVLPAAYLAVILLVGISVLTSKAPWWGIKLKSG